MSVATHSSEGSASAAEEWKFHIGRVQPMLPDFILHDWFWMANLAGLLTFTGIWAIKSWREYGEGRLHMPKFMLICCAMILTGCWQLTLLNMQNYLPISGIPVGVMYFAGVPASLCIGVILLVRIYRRLFRAAEGEQA